ncbi:N-acetylglucosamine kinase [Microbacterium dauci]|uniref:BadF/BadG/BcrA/BcrD ATPase family protein n=1 Tax=Microbacterium dauci TaxID=3048008 RepID=A0ABT6ZCG1_9MICO|nr:BadF/BadG/BcrA/BcrD ATPase family protein [Microbacterium sp. LX3-4]MDJ1113823.1 BadF/BadG/BcrA/BcrD ATPase family protein [Microbacterium sp. LX3-4]
MTPATLSVDAGQTGIKLRLSEDIHVLQMTMPGVRTHNPPAEQIAEAVLRAAGQWARPIHTVAAGVSGLVDDAREGQELLVRLEPAGVRRVVIAHDSVTSYLGALGANPGAVVAAGTGVVTLAVGARSVARVDGWGNLLGDAGSGYWIGRAGLEAAMRAYDGRAAPTRLLQMLTNQWPDPEAAYIDLQGDADRVRVVASFARQVGELAAVDATAAAICRAAAQELSMAVEAGLRRVQGGPEAWAEGPEVAAIGGVFDAEAIRRPFERLLQASWPKATISVPRGTGIDGAQALPSLAADHPLRSRVAECAVPAFTTGVDPVL